jgi:tol-pal system protein YbgF
MDGTMNRKATVVALALAAVMIFPAAGLAQKKEIVQLQTQMQMLTDQMQNLQRSNDERMGVMKNLIEQSSDTVNKLASTLDILQKNIQTQQQQTQAKVDDVAGQIQSLHDAVDELKVRMNNLSKQLGDIQSAQQNLNAAPPAGGAPGGMAQQQQQAPPADVLYNNALSDYNAGRYDLASQQFVDYIKYYPNTDLAGNAQYYIADVEYREGNFQQAVKDYDKVLEQYPGGNKAAAAQLKKGYALIELGQQNAGVQELNSLIQRYPRSVEATQAKERLRKLGVAPGTKPSAARRKSGD